MSPQDLKIGSAYYRVTFADPKLTIPEVRPLVFLGLNVFDSDGGGKGPVYTFQDAQSFYRLGNAVDFKGTARLSAEGVQTYALTSAQVGELADLSAAAEALNDAVERAHWESR